MVTTVLKHKDATVEIERLPSGKNKISVELLNTELFMPISTWETNYPIDLINKILELKGPSFLCDEIMRDESQDYIQMDLYYDLLSYVQENEFKKKRILDFGCGSGASTMVLCRMFPDSEIVGVELEGNLLSIAKLRAEYYGMTNRVNLLLSPNENSIPNNIGKFDYIILSAVYEHLLPRERKTILPILWDILRPDGILFINQTPFRYFPIESHTTNGLPFINFLPDNAALYYAHHFSKRKLKNTSWEDLLRKGIRGGSVKEILDILLNHTHKPFLLKPDKLGMKDRIDIWYAKSKESRLENIKKMIRTFFKLIKISTGLILLPTLSLAIKKQTED